MVASFWWWYYSTVYVHEYVRGSGNEYDEALIFVIENRLHQYPQVNTTFRPEVILSVTWTAVSSCMTILSAAELKCNNYYLYPAFAYLQYYHTLTECFLLYLN